MTTQAAPTMSEIEAPAKYDAQIYVACLADYNNGILHGRWIKAEDADQMEEDKDAILASSPIPNAEEHAIHDFMNFEGMQINEYDSFSHVAEVAAFAEEHGELGAAVFDHFGGSLDEAQKAMSDCYLGTYASLGDYAQQYHDDLGTEIPEGLQYYIDWDQCGKDMETNGGIFSIQTKFDEYHIFMS